MILSSPHVHTTHCDGNSTAEEMISAALEQGFQSLGFSGHAKQDFDIKYAMSEESEQAYIEEVLLQQRKHEKKIRIWLGMERDKYAYADRGPYNYVIASVHYLKDGDEYITLDGDPMILRNYVFRCFNGNGLTLVKAYYKSLTEYVCSYRPDIIGHFDLIKKNNKDNAYFDEESPAYRSIVYDSLEAIVKTGALLEVNTGGMARSGFDKPYPALFALERWHDLGGDVILSSDCHLAKNISYGYEKSLMIIRKAGFDSMLVLGTTKTALFERCKL